MERDGWLIGVTLMVGVFILALFIYMRSVQESLQGSLKQTQQNLQLQHLGSGKMLADGSEQILFEFVCITPFKIEGYVNLKNMADGDTVKIGEFIRLGINDKEYALYDDHDYKDKQAKPMVYVKPKPSIYGAKITLQQLAGLFKVFEWEFYKGVTS